MIQMSTPYLFRCPISLDIFTDPVTLSTGQTYDRPSIEKWLAGGNLTCPLTMQRLHDDSLVPNHTLRHLIDRWLLAGAASQKHPEPPASGGFDALKQSLQTPGTESKLDTLKKIRSLSVESDVGHACLIHLGFLPLVLQFLFQFHQPPFELVELALDCILSLCSATQIDSLNILQKDAAFASLVRLMNRGASSSKINTSICSLIETIASSPITHDLLLILGGTRAVMERVVALLRDAQTAEAAVGAVSALCGIEANRSSAVREGVVDGLVGYLLGTTGRGNAAVKALATLELATGTEAGRRGVVRSKGAVRMLVKMVFRVSSREHGQGSEHAVGALLAACRESGKARAEAVREGVVTQLLLLLQSQCGGRAKGKAKALLKLLRDAWTEDPMIGGLVMEEMDGLIVLYTGVELKY